MQARVVDVSDSGDTDTGDEENGVDLDSNNRSKSQYSILDEFPPSAKSGDRRRH